MKRLMTLMAAGTVLVAAAAGMAPQASASAPVQPVAAAAGKCTQYKVTGKRVAVRRPDGDRVRAADPASPVVRTLRRGDVVTSCATLIARTESGPAYHKCGKDGHLWRVIKGGQVPATCLRKTSG